MPISIIKNVYLLNIIAMFCAFRWTSTFSPLNKKGLECLIKASLAKPIYIDAYEYLQAGENSIFM